MKLKRSFVEESPRRRRHQLRPDPVPSAFEDVYAQAVLTINVLWRFLFNYLLAFSEVDLRILATETLPPMPVFFAIVMEYSETIKKTKPRRSFFKRIQKLRDLTNLGDYRSDAWMFEFCSSLMGLMPVFPVCDVFDPDIETEEIRISTASLAKCEKTEAIENDFAEARGQLNSKIREYLNARRDWEHLASLRPLTYRPEVRTLLNIPLSLLEWMDPGKNDTFLLESEALILDEEKMLYGAYKGGVGGAYIDALNRIIKDMKHQHQTANGQDAPPEYQEFDLPKALNWKRKEEKKYFTTVRPLLNDSETIIASLSDRSLERWRDLPREVSSARSFVTPRGSEEVQSKPRVLPKRARKPLPEPEVSRMNVPALRDEDRQSVGDVRCPDRHDAEMHTDQQEHPSPEALGINTCHVSWLTCIVAVDDDARSVSPEGRRRSVRLMQKRKRSCGDGHGRDASMAAEKRGRRR